MGTSDSILGGGQAPPPQQATPPAQQPPAPNPAAAKQQYMQLANLLTQAKLKPQSQFSAMNQTPTQGAQVTPPQVSPPAIKNPAGPPGSVTPSAQQFQGYADLPADQRQYAQAYDSIDPKFNAPTYHQPNKWLELGLGLMGLLSHNPNITAAAAGLAGGLNRGAEDRYSREDNAAKEQYDAEQQQKLDAAKRLGMQVTFDYSQEKMKATQEENEAKNEQANERIDLMGQRFKQSVYEWNHVSPATRARISASMEIAKEHVDAELRGQDISSETRIYGINVAAKTAALNRLAADARNQSNQTIRQADKEAQTAQKQADAQVANIKAAKTMPDASGNPVPATEAWKDQQIQGIYQGLSDKVNDILQKGSTDSQVNDLSTLSAGMDNTVTQLNYQGQQETLEDEGIQVPGEQGQQQGSPGQGLTVNNYITSGQQQPNYGGDGENGQQPQGYDPNIDGAIDGTQGNSKNQGQPPPGSANQQNRMAVYQMQLGALGQTHGLGEGPTLGPNEFKTFENSLQTHAMEIPDIGTFFQKLSSNPEAKQLSREQLGDLISRWGHTLRSNGKDPGLPLPPGQAPPQGTPNAPGGLDLTQPGLGLPKGPGGGPTASISPGNGTPVAEGGIQPQGMETAGINPNALTGVANYVRHIMGHDPNQAGPGSAGGWNQAHVPSKREVIQYAAHQYGVPMALMLAVGTNESGFNNEAISPTGARGIFQLEPGTAKALGVDPGNPTENVMGGAHYLSEQLKRFGSIPLAIAAYNAGPGNVIKYRGVPPFKETQDYVRKVMASYHEYLGKYPIASTSRQAGNF